MSEPAGLPVVVIVGRPNVGKSTLFNCILRERRSIVGDEPGITRDRIHGVAEHRGRRFEIIDTGGMLLHEDALIPREIVRQARVALEMAAHIIFLIDGRGEITAPDRELAQLLRRLGRPVSLAVNKIDSVSREGLAHEFYAMGIPDLFPVSAEHRLGIDELLEHVTAGFPVTEASDEPKPLGPIRIAIIGRPNVGKSTLLNALAGEDRAIVSPVAGTTRDAVDQTVIADGEEFVFVDTAGIRRKGKTKLMAEKLSVVMARRHLRTANVVLLILDATEGLLALDATIAGYAHEEGRAVIVCVNKWDAAPDKNRRDFLEKTRDAFKFLDYAPVVFLSAKTGEGVRGLFAQIRKVYDAASQRISTGELNRFMESVDLGHDQKIRYITQAYVRPPTFVLFSDRRSELHFSTERHLINRLRERFGFQGTPIVIKTKWRRS
jgi:GTP-binding protein